MSNTNNRSSDQKQSNNKLTHYMKAPFRALVRARDMYVRGLGGCAGRVERGRVISSAVAAPRNRSHGFYQSRNTSVHSNNDDVNDLIRAASQGRLGSLNSKDVTVVPRSQSVAVGVGIGRIDEDEPCDFGEQPTQLEVAYPRSRSYAVGVGVMEKRRRVGVAAA